MMNLKNALLSATVAVASLLPSATPLTASQSPSTYTFNRSDSNGLFIYNVKIISNGRYGNTFYIKYKAPTCSKHRYLAGTAKINYTSKDGGWIKNYQFLRFSRAVNVEGSVGTAKVNSKYAMSTEGNVRITSRLGCYRLNRY